MSLFEVSRGHLQKSRWYSLLHTWGIWCSLLRLGCKPVSHINVLNTTGNYNRMVLVYLNIEKVQKNMVEKISNGKPV